MFDFLFSSVLFYWEDPARGAGVDVLFQAVLLVYHRGQCTV